MVANPTGARTCASGNLTRIINKSKKIAEMTVLVSIIRDHHVETIFPNHVIGRRENINSVIVPYTHVQRLRAPPNQ